MVSSLFDLCLKYACNYFQSHPIEIYKLNNVPAELKGSILWKTILQVFRFEWIDEGSLQENSCSLLVNLDVDEEDLEEVCYSIDIVIEDEHFERYTLTYTSNAFIKKSRINSWWPDEFDFTDWRNMWIFHPLRLFAENKDIDDLSDNPYLDLKEFKDFLLEYDCSKINQQLLIEYEIEQQEYTQYREELEQKRLCKEQQERDNIERFNKSGLDRIIPKFNFSPSIDDIYKRAIPDMNVDIVEAKERLLNYCFDRMLQENTTKRGRQKTTKELRIDWLLHIENGGSGKDFQKMLRANHYGIK